jgi:hypothetical protein
MTRVWLAAFEPGYELLQPGSTSFVYPSPLFIRFYLVLELAPAAATLDPLCEL